MQDLPTPVTQGSSGGFGLFSKAGLMIAYVLRNWRVSITTLLFAILIIHAIIESSQQKNTLPIITELGGRIFLADTTLYEHLTNPPPIPINTDTIKSKFQHGWGFFWYYFAIFASVWFLVMLTYFIYRLLMLGNYERYGFNPKEILIAIFIIALLQTSFGLVAFIKESSGTQIPSWDQTQKNVFMNVVPFRGILKLLLQAPKVLSPAYALSSGIIDKDLRNNITQNFTTTTNSTGVINATNTT